jgi:hypothetical protein
MLLNSLSIRGISFVWSFLVTAPKKKGDMEQPEYGSSQIGLKLTDRTDRSFSCVSPLLKRACN